MKNKKIIVTGGAGFIGSNIARTLVLENKTTVIDNLSTGNLNNIKNLIDDKKIDFIKGSITDLSLLQDTFIDADYIFHQAALPSVSRSIKNPIDSNKTNIEGTLNVLLAARDNNVKKVVFASSSSVYGDTPSLPIEENEILCPLSPYAVNKITGEYYCQVFSIIYGLPTVSLRYFNVYGPRQDPNGEYAAVIPNFIMKIFNHKSPIIFGNGTQTRDFIYIDDVVKANILAAESKACGVFNIASGKKMTIKVLAETIMKVIGKKLEIKYNNPRPGDIIHSYADISKAKKVINYKPDFDIEKGLKKTVKWFQKSN